MPMINPYVTEEHLERAFPNQKGTRVVVEESALEAIKAMAQRLQDEWDELLNQLTTASAHMHRAVRLSPDDDFEISFRSALNKIDKLIAKCTAEPKVSE